MCHNSSSYNRGWWKFFPDDYSLLLAVAGVKTLISRRKPLTQQFYMQSVLQESSCPHYLLPDKCDPAILRDCHMPQHSNLCWLKLKNSANRSYHIVSITTIDYNLIYVLRNSRNILVKSVSFYLERFQRYGALKMYRRYTLMMTIIQGGLKSCTFLKTPYLWNRSG